MAKAEVFFVPTTKMIEFYTSKRSHKALAEELFAAGVYSAGPVVEMAEQAEDAAEELFDLSNNPTRSRERVARYGSAYRSISVGDIIRVDGVMHLCAAEGWM